MQSWTECAMNCGVAELYGCVQVLRVLPRDKAVGIELIDFLLEADIAVPLSANQVDD